MHSGERVDLDSVTQQVEGNLSKGQVPSNYKFFKSKNSATEKDIEAVSSYQSVLRYCKEGVTSFFGSGRKALSTQNRPKSANASGPSQPLYSRQPQQLDRRTRANDGTDLIPRCEKCKCIKRQRQTCQYCLNKTEIEIIDSESDSRSFGQQGMTSAQMTAGRGIPTGSFYTTTTKENNASRGSPSLNVFNSSALNASGCELNKKYEVDYLYVGTYRFLSRTFIRITNECLVLNMYSYKESVNIDFKLIKYLHYCIGKIENHPKHTYIRIDFMKEAVEAINQYINRAPDADGSFRFESINGHEKYFVMKLKFLQPIEATELKNKLRVYLPDQFKEDLSVVRFFEEQRQYCLTLRSRSKRQKTADHSKTRNQDSLRDAVRESSRGEPMEIETYSRLRNKSPLLGRPLSGYNTRSSGAYEKPSSLPIKRSFGSNNSIKMVLDDDMEVSEVTESDLSFKNIKNSKIVFETAMGEHLVILKSDLNCLSDGNFLNDKIIEFYLIYIKSKLIDPAIAEKTYIFSSFFFTKMLSLTKGTLSEEDFNENLYNLVKNWTKNVDIFNYDYLIVPIFKSSHWSLAIIVYPGKVLLDDDFEIVLDDNFDQKPCIIFMDSMGRSRAAFNRYSKLLRNFLRKECANKKEKQINFSPDEMIMLDPEVPCQLNGYDCGIFILNYVELFLKNPQSIIPRVRTKKLNDWFSSSDLRGKRKEIFNILLGIHDENLSNNLKFESDEDATLKSDEEIEILTSDQSDERNESDARIEKNERIESDERSNKEIRDLLSDDDDTMS